MDNKNDLDRIVSTLEVLISYNETFMNNEDRIIGILESFSYKIKDLYLTTDILYNKIEALEKENKKLRADVDFLKNQEGKLIK